MNSFRLLIVLMFFLSCKDNVTNKLEYTFKEVDFNIQKFIDGNKEVVNMNELISFKWDKVYVFKPYSTPEMINQELGFSWKDVLETGISENDSYCLLVFVKGGKVNKYLKWPRNQGDFSDLSKNHYLLNKAVFNIKKERYGGQDWFFFRYK